MAHLTNMTNLPVIAAVLRWIGGAMVPQNLYDHRVERQVGRTESVTYRVHNWMSQPQCCSLTFADGTNTRTAMIHVTKVTLNQAGHAYASDAVHVHHVDTTGAVGINLSIAPAMAAFVEIEYLWTAGSVDPQLQIGAYNPALGAPIEIENPNPAFAAPVITPVAPAVVI